MGSVGGTMGGPKRADAPVAKVDFVDSLPQGTNVETASPQPADHALVAEGAVEPGGAVPLDTRADRAARVASAHPGLHAGPRVRGRLPAAALLRTRPATDVAGVTGRGGG